MDNRIEPQQALGLGEFGGKWDVGTVKDISNAAQVHITIGRDTRTLRIYSDSAIYVLFDTTSNTANSTANDIILPAGYYDIPIPRGLYVGEGLTNATIYMHAKQVTSAASKKLRYVES
jgi:hypothetical protein